MMRRDTCSKLGKIVRPPKGEIDLGEKRVDFRDDIAFMMHVLTLKGLDVKPICDSALVLVVNPLLLPALLRGQLISIAIIFYNFFYLLQITFYIYHRFNSNVFLSC